MVESLAIIQRALKVGKGRWKFKVHNLIMMVEVKEGAALNYKA
jgi:hypothetical protein